jgi:hypothetical protein
MKIYLACPYSHPDPTVREKRFRSANHYAAYLLRQGHIVFSPLSHSHPIAVQCGLPETDFEFWQAFSFAFVDWAEVIHVLMLDGWDTSIGVEAETRRAVEHGKLIEYVRPTEKDNLCRKY